MNKFTKSFFGLLLGATFCFGLVASLNANKTNEIKESRADDTYFIDNLVIYVDKTNVDWMDLHIYHTTNGKATYSEMTQVSGNFYKYPIPANTTKFIVNHGAQDYGGNCRTAEITPSSLVSGNSFHNLITLGTQATPISVTYGHYVEAPTTDTHWYLTGEFNNWDKADPKCHLTYGSHQGNNEQYDSDYAITIKRGTKFNFVYAWDSTHYYTYAPDLQGDVSTTSFTKTSDYFTANSDLVAKFYFQVWYNNNKPGWSGLYSYVYASDSEYEDDFKTCLESWAYDFVELTGDICDGTDKNNETALQAIWNDTSLKATTSSWYVAGDFTNWGTNKVAMFDTTTSGVCKLTNVFITESHGFKVTDGGSGWYPNDNVYPASNGYYTITFNTSTHEVSYEKQSHQYLETSFKELFSAAQSKFTSDNSNPKTAIAYQRYAHIVHRYSSLDNFANIAVSSSSNLIIATLGMGSNSSLIIIVIISSLTILSVGAYYFFRKSRKSEE